MKSFNKVTLAAALAATFGTGSALAAQVAAYAPVSSTGGNFTVLTPDSPTYNGYAFGGTNDVTFTWDGTIFTASSDYTGPGGASNATLSSPTFFYGKRWTAHDVQIFGSGTYTFDVTLGVGVPESGTLTMTVGANQLGAHMLFDWGGNYNIDVVNVWNLNTTFSSCGTATIIGPAGANCLWTGVTNTAGNTASTVWLFVSTDDDGDGTLGIPMASGGPFENPLLGSYNFNFNMHGTLTAVPIPAAVWLFGSGLLGLIGAARCKRKSC